MSRPRDGQLSKVAQAMIESRKGWGVMQETALEQWANKATYATWVRQEAAGIGRTVSASSLRVGSGHRCYPFINGHTAQFFFGPTEATRLDLWHAVAHLITPDDVALHGPQWAKNFLAVMQKFEGTHERNQVRDAFKQYGVKYIMRSEATREKARQRAAEQGVPWAPKVSREEQQAELVAMLRELAGLPAEEEPADPIDAMLKAAKRKQP